MELQDDIIDFDLIDIDSVDEQPSILARETINNSKDQSITTLLVCPECGELLELKLINVKEIECKCKCGYFEIISINEFFIHLSNQKVPKKFCQNPNKHRNNKVKGTKFCKQCNMWYCSSCLHEHQQLIGNQHDLFINDLVGKCAKHNQEYNTFCLKCKAHICGLCLLQDHKGHEFVDLKEMLNIDNFIEINMKCAKAKKTITLLNEDYKNKLVKELNDKIEQIEKDYLVNVQLNKNILNFIEILIKNYSDNLESPNYYIIKNLLNNTNFCFDDKKLMKKYHYSYFKHFFIVNITSKEKKLKRFLPHTENITCLLALNDGRLASGSEDKTINIYDSSTYKTIQTLADNTGKITSLIQLKNGNIVSSSSDSFIKVYTENIQHKFTLSYSMDTRNKGVNQVIELSSNTILSCSMNGLIQEWDNIYCIRYFNNKKQPKDPVPLPVDCIIELKDKQIVSASGTIPFFTNGFVGKYISFWEGNQETKVEINNTGRHCFFELDNSILLVGVRGGVCLVNTKSHEIEKQITTNVLFGNEEGSMINTFYYCKDGLVFGGNDKGELQVYEIDKQKIVVKFKLHGQPINEIVLLKNNLIASCSEGKALSIWAPCFQN